ncbi:cytoplasmic tRNA 2-thiolation protein 2 domain-containing protein [Sarocladium implicatum]|nr:cytoplasmic tRNA 2-thiolation protein 2 domain-containing protein [Sarocladium implicatum]
MTASDKPCTRCKAPNAPHILRNDPTCSSCYISYIDQKIARRLTVVHRNTTPTSPSSTSVPTSRRFLAALSFGPCSSLLAHSLHRAAKRHRERRSAVGTFETLVVHVDTSLAGLNGGSPANELVARYEKEYPALELRSVPLERVLEVRTVDWATLSVGKREEDPTTRLKTLFNSLPSVSSRTDVLRLLVRHLLIHLAVEGEYSALLLGNTTTALAALTLAEVANGRGYSVPWHVDDGAYPVTTYDPLTPGLALSKSTFPIYYPLREIFSGEVSTYVSLTSPLSELTPKDGTGDGTDAAVVSHKDLSISEVMTRYFSSVEGPYAGIVTNVVRTTGKLERPADQADAASCGLCGIALDLTGNETWAGELGEEDAQGQRLCYGCRRSVNG